MAETTNPHQPPSSAEEAAALLGAAISFAAADPHMASGNNDGEGRHANPPAGMHSIFAVQSPVPNGVLFVRLCNLREWLRWHAMDEYAEDRVEDPLKQALQVSLPPRDKPPEPFTASRSVLAVLMKLLEVTSSISDTEEKDKPLAGLGSPKTKQKRVIKQHKALPPLLSTPLRRVWVNCVASCISLGSSLPGNQRTDVYAFITKMMDIVNMNPRTKLASGGVRHAALEVIERICTLNHEMAKRSAPYALEILQCCHRGLLSGGTGEPGHRAQCVKVASGLMIGCRRASKNGNDETYILPGALEDQAAVEAIKLMKRAVSDKYPEVRMAAATFAGLVAPMLIRNPSTRKDGENVSPLGWLEDVTQIALKHIDDESAGVATAWAQSLARCLCASAEYGKNVRDAQSEDQANKRSADVDDEDVVDNNNLDFAGKFKAFTESKRAAVVTLVCSSALAAVKFLTTQFVKCGGESASNKCGGMFSIGGRATRVGYCTTLTEFLRLQAAKGDFSLTEALSPALDMVGASFEKQANRVEQKTTALADTDLYAPSSPYSSPEKKAQPSISTTFLMKSSKSSSSDSTIGRLLASIVLRRGISENLSELLQLSVLKELTDACRVSVVDGSVDSSRPANDEHVKVLNRHQIQIALVEMSHLVITLGEAGAASLEEILPVVKDCLSDRDHGVRYEAATLYTSIAQAFPSVGKEFVIESLSGFIANMDTIQSLSMRVISEAPSTPKGRFRKGAKVNVYAPSQLSNELMQRQCGIHGNALAVSMLMNQFPHVLGGIQRVIVDKLFDVCEKLIKCQSNEAFVKASPSAVCSCIRAGYCMLSGVFTMGVDAVVCHVTTVFSLWQATSLNVLPGVSKQSPSHDLLCVESMLSSIVAYLKFCPTLLLSVPDALNRTTSILEKIFPLVSSQGRFESEDNTAIGNARLSNARSAIFEAYSWLPPGSFPMSADRIFTFAAKQIQELSSSGSDVVCSILSRLVSHEDDLIDAHSSERAVSPGQVGQMSTLDIVISIRSSDIVTSYEREAIMNLISLKKPPEGSKEYHGSQILGSLLHEEDNKPTQLHEVGSWRQPFDPIPKVKVRLIDSAMHVFAATFGLQDPHTQSEALRMLESLYVSTQTEKSNRFNVNAALITDSQGKVRPLEEDAITFNVTAVVLACLQAIPLHEATYGTLIGKGPPWMERATNILLQLIPSPSNVIRRGAAEGLSFLATLGNSEDANTLQSTILHALDEVMKGNNFVPSQKTSTEFTTFGRSGSLLSLACIQRTSKRIETAKIARLRSVSHAPEETNTDAPPVLIMMTRLLPSLATHSHELDSSIVRVHALQAFGVLISSSFPKPTESLSPEQKQIVWKAVEAVETSFLASWSAVMLDYNKGREREKFTAEPALVAAICRLMTILLPWLSHLVDLDKWIPSRFSCYAAAIAECIKHNTVLFEASVFFDSLGARRDLNHPNKCCVVRTVSTSAMAMPLLLYSIKPGSTEVIAEEVEFRDSRCTRLQRAAVMCQRGLCANAPSGFVFNTKSALCLFLHDLCGRKRFHHISELRSVVQLQSLHEFDDMQAVESQVIALTHCMLNALAREGDDRSVLAHLLQWLLFSRCLISGISSKSTQDLSTITSPIERKIELYRMKAQVESSVALGCSNPRWQLKCAAANMSLICVNLLLDRDEKPNWSDANDSLPPFPAYLEELVLTACSASASSSNHSELISVQIAGIKLLAALFKAFGGIIDSTTDDGSSVLQQYSSQIISAVKHSLKCELWEASVVSGYHLLFSAGCEALLLLLESGFISDPVALKRLVKPVMISEVKTLVQFPSDRDADLSTLVATPHSITDDLTAYPSFRLSKLCFIAKASMMIAYDEIDQSAAAVIMEEFELNEQVRAVLSAAAAIDGFMLMKGSEVGSGLTFKNRADLNVHIVEGLIENWATLCASAVESLVKGVGAANEQNEDTSILQGWLKKVSAIALVGLKSSLSELSNESAEHAQACVYAIRILVKENASNAFSVLQPPQIYDVIAMVTQSVIYPSLGFLEHTSLAAISSSKLLKQSCGLLEDVSKHMSILGSFSPIMHASILTPLKSLQEGKFVLDADNDFIISSCIRASIPLLQSCSERGQLERALLQFALSTLTKLQSNKEKSSTEPECISMVKACQEDSALSTDEWRQVIAYAAANELWEAWSILISDFPSGDGILCSTQSFKKSIGDLNASPRNQIKGLAALRNGLQSAVVENPTAVGTILHVLGFEIFQVFRYLSMNMGLNYPAEDKLIMCAECIKIIMVAYQCLISVSIEESKFIAFMASLFTLLVESVSFNGLPNSPSGKAGADDKIGKMCAQVFVHIARTTPPIFKSTMASVIPECRSTIEAAVRADMSGYVSVSQGPAKKKLSLTGFVR